jgi:hypothetical protein
MNWRRFMCFFSSGSRLYRHSAQGEPKVVVFCDPERSVLKYVSTGSAEKRHLQAAIS